MISRYGHRAQDQAKWIKEIGRPELIRRYGEVCNCCGTHDDLTVDHIKTKGSRPDLKKNIDNLQFLCFVCHRNKTDHLTCVH